MREQQPELPDLIGGDLSRRAVMEGTGKLLLSAAALWALNGCTTAPSPAPGPKPESTKTPERPEEIFLLHTAESLLSLGEESNGGLRFQSEIQAPNYQVDRDVGAASVGMGFLAMAEKYPENPKWIEAAKKTAAWLTAVSSPDEHGGRYWHDYVNSESDVSTDVYTSFDDGAIGIGDFYWRLYEATNIDQYKTTAFETLEWTFSQAENVGQGEDAYRWRWDIGDHSQPYYIGMGEGVVGIIHTLATYYDRIVNSDPEMAAKCKSYMEGGLRYLDQARAELVNQTSEQSDIRAIPYTDPNAQQDQEDGNTEMDSGYLSGAAGAAFMYLKLHQVFGNEQDTHYLDKANVLFGWLEDSQDGPLVESPDGSVTWKLSLDPQGGDDDSNATGFEEGNAGIGWVYLQAYSITHNRHYLTMAQKSADWLLNAAKNDNGALSWHEDEHPTNPLVHANLNNGAAGIGSFLQDMYLATGGVKYGRGARGALKWLMTSARHYGEHIYWKDNGGFDNGNSGPSSPYNNDPSWHWGDAGIMAFALRMVGGGTDIPGEQSALLSKS